MSEIVQFKDLQAKQQEKQSIQQQKEHMNWLISLLTKEQLEELLVTMETGNFGRYKEITEPIIMREAIREFNKEG